MGGCHTRWVRAEEIADHPKRIAIREALTSGKALHGIRTELSLHVTELAPRAAMTEDDTARIEDGGTQPTVPSHAGSPRHSMPLFTSHPDTT